MTESTPTFADKVDYPAGFSGPYLVSVGDFNNDGKDDLALASFFVDSHGTISVLLRNASNTGFDANVEYITKNSFPRVQVGDFNNDGKADLATLNYNESTVSIFLRNASNTGFDANLDYDVIPYPSTLIVADFNNDGKSDLAVTNDLPLPHQMNIVSVLLRNTANTGFDAKIDYETDSGLDAQSVTVGDFNNDGKADLAVANYGNDTVSVLLNTSTPGVHAALTIADTPNHAPTGSVTLSDTTPETGQTLTAGNTLEDADGLGVITYSWLANGLEVGNGESYTVTTNDVGKFLRVIASYTDGLGKLESISSANSSRVTFVKLNLIGTDADDVLNGGEGNDTLNGIAGNDTLNGGAGHDVLAGAAGDDVENGQNGDDVLWGISGNNILDGGAGNDRLIAGKGHNQLTGGDGGDSFRFASASRSTITDFVVADDTIKLENKFFTRLTATGALSAEHFVTSAAAADSNDYVIYDNVTGALRYDADGNGADAAVPIAMLGVNLSLSSANFMVI